MEQPQQQPRPQKEVVIMVGYPGSGKSTWAIAEEKNGYIRIDGDNLKTPNKMVKEAQKHISTCKQGIIFDSTGGTKKRRETFIAFAKIHGLPVKVIWFQTSIEESMRRNALRLKPVPKIAYWSYRKHFQIPEEDEGCQVLKN